MQGSNAPEAGQLAMWLDQATSGNHLPNPWLEVQPDLSDANRANSTLYIRALRSRLNSLGYLADRNRDGDTLSPELSQAIKAFQFDAALKEDGWAGPLTKQRLQQLVSFEDEQAPETWDTAGKDPGRLQAVRRAVYLRLYTLGFMDWDAKLTPGMNFDPAENSSFRDALQRFLAVMHALHLSDRVLDPVLDMPVLRVVFGHDSMIRMLATDSRFVDDHANRRYVDAIGKVELWLLDYDVKLANGDNTRYEPAPPRAPVAMKHVDAVQDALADLRDRFPEAKLPGPDFLRPMKFSVEFFTLTSSLNSTSDDDVSPPELEDSILNAAKTSGEDIIGKLNQLAARVWDGFRRLWGFLKHLVKKGVATIKDQLWRIARFISAKARGAFEVVLKAIEIIHRGSVYLRSRIFPSSDPEAALLLFAKDFDATFLIQQDAPLQQVLRVVEHDALETRFFVAACRILSCLLGIIIEVVRAVATGMAGWFLLLLSLSRIASRIKGLIVTIEGVDIECITRFDAQEGKLYANSTI